MNVSRNNSKANFDDLAVGDKYFGHVTGKLCVKSDNSHGVRQEDLAVGYVPPGTVVKLPVQKGQLVYFYTLAPGKTFIPQNVPAAEQAVYVKTEQEKASHINAVRLGNGEKKTFDRYAIVEHVEGTFAFSGKN